MAVKFELAELPEGASTEQVLDVMVNQASLGYVAAHRIQELAFSDDRDHPIAIIINNRFHELALLSLAFVADARARLDKLPVGQPEETAWVQVAKDGLRRVAREVSDSRGLDRLNIFNDDESEQRRQYYDMCSRRFFLGARRLDPKSSYSENVAMQNIGLTVTVNHSMS